MSTKANDSHLLRVKCRGRDCVLSYECVSWQDECICEALCQAGG